MPSFWLFVFFVRQQLKLFKEKAVNFESQTTVEIRFMMCPGEGYSCVFLTCECLINFMFTVFIFRFRGCFHILQRGVLKVYMHVSSIFCRTSFSSVSTTTASFATNWQLRYMKEFYKLIGAWITFACQNDSLRFASRHSKQPLNTRRNFEKVLALTFVYWCCLRPQQYWLFRSTILVYFLIKQFYFTLFCVVCSAVFFCCFSCGIISFVMLLELTFCQFDVLLLNSSQEQQHIPSLHHNAPFTSFRRRDRNDDWDVNPSSSSLELHVHMSWRQVPGRKAVCQRKYVMICVLLFVSHCRQILLSREAD